MKRVVPAANHADLASELWAEARPIALEYQPDVVLLPRTQHLLIQLACLAVKHFHRPSVLPARAPHPFERCALASVLALDFFLFGELLEGDQVLSAHPHKIPGLAVGLAVSVVSGSWRCIDPCEASQVNRVGRGGPRASEEVRIC